MSFLTDLLSNIPKALRVPIACILIGGVAFAGHETRYMTVDQYTKSYVLDLKREIRNIRKDLTRDIDPEIRQILEDQLAEMLDELCYETPEDPYCD